MAVKRNIGPDDPRHGSANAYNNYGCRCSACRAAWADYMREYKRRWLGRNPDARERLRAYRRQYRAEHPDKLEEQRRRRARAQGLRRNRAYAEAIRLSVAPFCKRSASSYRKGCRCPDCLEAGRAYAREHYAQRRTPAYRCKRAAITWQQIDQLKQEHGGLCFYCGGSADTIDHVIPLSRGGQDPIDNLVPACRSCNSSKGQKLVAEWRGPCSFRGI